MLDNLRGMAVFASVVENGSFSGSAKQLGITTSAVSQQIRSLEKDLGVVLLHRSTRKISLTEAGEGFFKRCQHIVETANQSKIELDLLKDELTGGIRLATTPELAKQHVVPALKTWLNEHDELSVHFEAHDSYIDLIERRIDIALRISQQPSESSFLSEELAEVEQILVASGAYLSQSGTVQSIDDLKTHQLIGTTLFKDAAHLDITKDNKKVKVKLPTRMTTNNVEVLKSLTLEGYGMARMLSINVENELKHGSLVQVLPEWQLPKYKLYAVTLKREHQPQKIARCLALLKAHFKAR